MDGLAGYTNTPFNDSLHCYLNYYHHYREAKVKREAAIQETTIDTVAGLVSSNVLSSLAQEKVLSFSFFLFPYLPALYSCRIAWSIFGFCKSRRPKRWTSEGCWRRRKPVEDRKRVSTIRPSPEHLLLFTFVHTHVDVGNRYLFSPTI